MTEWPDQARKALDDALEEIIFRAFSRDENSQEDRRTEYVPQILEALAPFVAAVASERDALAAFKAYTHERLDGAGVPTHPDGRHSAQGCRVGDRFDILIAQRDAGREWMRRAWHEFNAIRARDGAPDGVSHEWWDEMTEAMREMLGDDALPWMTKAARLLVAPIEAERAVFEAERDAARADVERLKDIIAEASRCIGDGCEDEADKVLRAALAVTEGPK